MMSAKGFTLNEMMMAVIIVGILAALAIPNYMKTVERGYFREANDILMAIYNGERSYFFANDAYQPVAVNATMDQWRAISMDNPHISSILVTFSVAPLPGPPSSFLATATRNGGPCDGSTVTINDQRAVISATASCWCTQC